MKITANDRQALKCNLHNELFTAFSSTSPVQETWQPTTESSWRNSHLTCFCDSRAFTDCFDFHYFHEHDSRSIELRSKILAIFSNPDIGNYENVQTWTGVDRLISSWSTDKLPLSTWENLCLEHSSQGKDFIIIISLDGSIPHPKLYSIAIRALQLWPEHEFMIFHWTVNEKLIEAWRYSQLRHAASDVYCCASR